MHYYVYLIIALCCFVGELFTMEFSLTCLGIGCLGAALVAWLGTPLWLQVSIFALVSVVCWLGVRPFLLKHLFKKENSVKAPADDVIGKPAVVEVAINPSQGTGRVRVGGESWKATSQKSLAIGTQCMVVKLEGVTLLVKEK